LFLIGFASATYRPVVLWHGMGDTCCYSFSMGYISGLIQSALPGIYVYSVEIGGSITFDEIEGFIGNANDQIDFVCNQIASDPNLAKGFNAIGFSQGSQLLRGVAERCTGINMYNLITMGGQHFGVADLPGCLDVNGTICELVEDLLELGAYNEIVQEYLMQAQYFRDPVDYDTYLSVNTFLADINNEQQQKNATYKQNLLSLNQLVLVKWLNDTVVVPRESEWFGYYKIGDLNTKLTMEQQDIYQQDWIGLKQLDQSGRLIQIALEGEHMDIDENWFNNFLIPKFLDNEL